MQVNKIKESEELDLSIIGDTREYALYAIEAVRTLSEMQRNLSDYLEPKKAAMEIMKVAVDFYDADWCGILEVNTDLGVWTPVWWFNRELGEMAKTHFNEFELTDGYGRWLDCLDKHEPVIIQDVKDIKEEYPEEYILYQRLLAKSLLAVPFWKGLHGFLVVRNPKRYKNETSFLRMLNFAIVSSLNEYYLMERNKLSVVSPRIRNEKDVYISLFGELEVTTAKGVLNESTLKSPNYAKLLAYLLLNKNVATAPRKLAEVLWSDDDTESVAKNMKGLVHRMQGDLSRISDYRMVISTSNGYQLNPELNFFTDVQLFDNKWDLALKTDDPEEKIATLKKAIDLYKGALFKNFRHEHWLMSTTVAYEFRYIGALCELMQTLVEEKDYVCIQQYAANALQVVPHNIDAYYWMIYSMYQLNRPEMARNELKTAQKNLLREEYEELIKRLSDAGFL